MELGDGSLPDALGDGRIGKHAPKYVARRPVISKRSVRTENTQMLMTTNEFRRQNPSTNTQLYFGQTLSVEEERLGEPIIAILKSC